VTHLEGDHRADVQRDALLGHAGLGDLGLLHGKREIARLAETWHDERAVSGDSPEGSLPQSVTASGDQHGLVRRGNAVAQHNVTLLSDGLDWNRGSRVPRRGDRPTP